MQEGKRPADVECACGKPCPLQARDGIEGDRRMSAGVPGLASERRWLIGLVIIYLLVGIPVAWRCVDQINPDGVCHLMLARHYAEGNFDLAVVGLWSPLLAWLIAALMLVKVEPQAAARAILLVSSLGLTLASWLLMGQMGVRGMYRRAATVCMAVVALSYSVFVLDPDVLAAALLAVYFWMTLRADTFEKPWAAFQLGLLVGAAYLTKAYALPFFALHFLGIAICYGRQKQRGAPARAATAYGLAVVGALVVGGPWIGTLSAQYGRLTFSTSGEMNLSWTGPVVNRRHRHLRGLVTPREGRLTEWEDPTDGTRFYPKWSPLDDMASFKHQMRVIWSNVRLLLQHRFFIYHLSILSAVLLYVLLLRRGWRGHLPVAGWAIWTIAVYAPGYLLIIVEDRYYWPLVPVVVGMSFLMLQMLEAAGSEDGTSTAQAARRAVWCSVLLGAMLAALPFASLARRCLIPATAGIPLLAEDLRSLPVAPPLAANNWNVGLYAAYDLNMVYMGRPAHNAPEEIAAELCSARARTYLVFDDAKLAAQLRKQRDLKHLATLQLKGHPFGDVAVFDVQCGDVIRPERMGETWP